MHDVGITLTWDCRGPSCKIVSVTFFHMTYGKYSSKEKNYMTLEHFVIDISIVIVLDWATIEISGGAPQVHGPSSNRVMSEGVIVPTRNESASTSHFFVI